MNRETLIVLVAAGGLSVAGALAAAVLAPGPPPPDLATAAPPRAASLDALMARVDAEPEDVEAWRALGRLHLAEGRYRAAVEAWTWIKELRPRDPEAASALAELESIARERRVHTIPDPLAAGRPAR